MSGSVLVVEDDADTASLFVDALRSRGFTAELELTAEAGLRRLATRKFDVVVTDVQMPGTSGTELCRMLHDRDPDLLTIVVTGVAELATAVDAIRAGAYDFLLKPVTIDSLAIAVTRALATLTLRRHVRQLRDATLGASVPGIAGSSGAIRETVALVRRLAPSEATVLITGESGTGKELVARALHAMSPRRTGPFVAINCAAMSPHLLESELFGHVRGAFTDANRARPGVFVQATGGTLFLDEIGEMPLETQSKLLRALQDHAVRPVGSDSEIAVDVRIIAATNKTLEAEVEDRRFREDLFYRINVLTIAVPPLRARDGDVLALAHHFLRRSAARANKPVRGISEPAARMLLAYDWPGNVRELENWIERAVALCRLDHLTVDDLPVALREYRAQQIVVSTTSANDLVTLDELGRRYTRHVLERVEGNKTMAARILGIDRRSLYRRLTQPLPKDDS